MINLSRYTENLINKSKMLSIDADLEIDINNERVIIHKADDSLLETVERLYDFCGGILLEEIRSVR